jgi:hypothetical protein
VLRVFLVLQVKDMAAKTEQTVSVDSLVNELKRMLSAPSPPLSAAADGAAAELAQMAV